MWIGEWVDGHNPQGLDFCEFCTDPMQWGSSEGAPARHISTQGDEKILSKLTWAIDTIAHGQDVYTSTKQENQRCTVALRKEAKTRLVITMPMSLYFRQSYNLRYALRKPTFLNSTQISNE